MEKQIEGIWAKSILEDLGLFKKIRNEEIMNYDKNKVQEEQNREMRAHQMYHVLLNTSEIYQNKMEELRDTIDDIYRFRELEKELEIILSVFREICGLRAMNIKSNEE